MSIERTAAHPQVIRGLSVLLTLLLAALVVAVLVADARSSWPLALAVSSAVTALLGAAVVVLAGGRR